MYKTIVVHVDGSPEQEARLRAGALLANAFDAHLVGSAATGISWFDYSLLVGSMGAPMMPESDFSGVREAVEARLEEFRTAIQRHGVESFETRMLEDDARYALLLESRYADLVIVSRDGEPIAVPGIPAQARGLPEYVALHGARPVLVVPPGWKTGPCPAPPSSAGMAVCRRSARSPPPCPCCGRPIRSSSRSSIPAPWPRCMEKNRAPTWRCTWRATGSRSTSSSRPRAAAPATRSSRLRASTMPACWSRAPSATAATASSSLAASPALLAGANTPLLIAH